MKKIAIHSVPRSGSTWLGELINSSPHVCYKYQPLFSYELKDYLNENSSKEKIDAFFEKLAHTNTPFLDQEEAIKKGIIPEFKKEAITHVVYKEVRYHHILENMLQQAPDVKVIGLVRNPLAVINSWLQSPREFRKDLGWDALKEWRSGQSKNEGRVENFFGFDKWKVVTTLFEKLQNNYPERFLMVRYNQLLNNTKDEVERVYHFCGLTVSEQTKKFIERSTSVNKDDVYAVYKQKVDDNEWRGLLPAEIRNSIVDELTGTTLKKYLKDS